MEIEDKPTYKYHKHYYKIKKLFKDKPKKEKIQEFIKKYPESVVYISRKKAEDSMKKYVKMVKSDEKLKEIYDDDLKKAEKMIKKLEKEVK